MRRKRQGYILISTAFLLTAIVAISGLSFDLGRLYIARNEAQSYADAAALAAAKALNGTLSGITTARNNALAINNRHAFGTAGFTGTVIEFSTSQNGPWEANPASAVGVRFARVIATAPTNVYLMRVVNAAGTSSPAALAVAGQVPQARFNNGLFPFSPFTLNGTPPNFGLQVCNSMSSPTCETSFYALRWPPGNFGNQTPMRIQGNGPIGNVCPGDYNSDSVTKATTADADVRGYWGPFGNASVQRQAIINDEMPPNLNLTIGTNLPMNGGNMQTQVDSTTARVLQDTDSVSRTYQQYLSRLDSNGNRVGNGRRVIGVPMNSGPPNFTVVGIGGFFLLTTDWYNVNGNQPICAEYIGPFTMGGGGGSAGGTSGSFVVRLVQ